MLNQQHVTLATTGIAGTGVVLRQLSESATIINPEVTAHIQEFTQPIAMIFLIVIGGAFALFPDLDAPGATLDRKFPILGLLFRLVYRQHRGMSHSFLTAVIFGALGFFLQTLTGSFEIRGFEIEIPKLIIATVFAGSLSVMLRFAFPIARSHSNILTAASFVVLLLTSQADFVPSSGLGVAMFLGISLHIVGDSLTPTKVRPFRPFSKAKFGVNINGTTGAWRELHVTRPLLLFSSTVGIYFAVVHPLIGDRVLNLIQGA